MKKENKKRKSSKQNIVIILAGMFIIAALVGIFVYQQSVIKKTREAVQYNTYSMHYVVIPTTGNDAFWNEVYESAKAEGAELGVFVERFGDELTTNYSRNELLQMAIRAKVDGIIIEGDDSEETVALINQANEKGIAVITVLGDAAGSERLGYVGINSYQVGEEYAKCIARDIEARYGSPVDVSELQQVMDAARVLVVANSDSEGSNQGGITQSMRSFLTARYGSNKIEVNSEYVEERDDFAMEEYMRTLFLNKEELPDYLVCLDSISSAQAYQAAVDYNAVGEVVILGYYETDTILSAVSKGVLTMTISMDTERMGRLCVDALVDYEATGYANYYQTVDYQVLDKEAAAALLKEREESEESEVVP